MKTSGVFQELKDRQYYKKPSEVKREKAKERMVNLKKAQKLRRNFL
jgi:ribosomal protein S21